MRDTDDISRLWSLRVEHENGEHAFDVFFADVDPSITSYPAEVRMVVGLTCRRLDALTEARAAARATRMETRILLARSRGKPQLVYAADH